MRRTKIAVSEVYGLLKERAKEVDLNIRFEKIKVMVQNRRTRRIREILTIKDHNIEVVRSFKYLETEINNTNDETEEIEASILAANKAYSFLLYIYKQIHRNNNLRLYKTLIKPVLCYGSVTRTLTQMTGQMLRASERKILTRIYDEIQDIRHWPRRWNSEIYNIHKYMNIVENIKIRKLGWAGYVIGMEDERITP